MTDIKPPEISKEDQELATSRKWRAPHYPFVAFRCRKAEILDPKERASESEQDTGMRGYEEIVNFNVGGVHRQVSKLERIIRNKRFKIVTWGNFPKPDSTKAKALRQGPEEPSDWELLEQFLQSTLSGQAKQTSTERGLRARVAELEAEQAKTKKSKEDK